MYRVISNYASLHGLCNLIKGHLHFFKNSICCDFESRLAYEIRAVYIRINTVFTITELGRTGYARSFKWLEFI